jgi:hypothetical protein
MQDFIVYKPYSDLLDISSVFRANVAQMEQEYTNLVSYSLFLLVPCHVQLTKFLSISF